MDGIILDSVDIYIFSALGGNEWAKLISIYIRLYYNNNIRKCVSTIQWNTLVCYVFFFHKIKCKIKCYMWIYVVNDFV